MSTDQPTDPAPTTTGSESPRRRLSAETRRAQLVDAARKAFVRDGWAVTTKDIAADAGVNQGLLYHYFQSKEELFEEAIAAPLEQLVRDLSDSAHKLADGADESVERRSEILRQMHAGMLDIMVEVVPLLGIALFSDPAAGQVFFRDRLRPVLNQIATAVQDGLAGWARPGLDPATVATAVFGLHFSSALQLALLGEGDREQISTRLADLLSHGLEPH